MRKAMKAITDLFRAPPTAKTPREVRLEALLRQCLPIVEREELGTRTNQVIRNLIDSIKTEVAP
jgi:hypothetical protein